MQKLLFIFLMFSHESGPAKWGHCGWFLLGAKSRSSITPWSQPDSGHDCKHFRNAEKEKERRRKKEKRVRKKHENYWCFFVVVRQG